MKLVRRARLLGAALALAGAATLASAASPAYAGTGPTVFAFGGPEEVWVYGTNFPVGATVRVEVLTDPGLSLLAPSQYTTVNSGGHIAIDIGSLKSSGPVWVLTDLMAPYGGTFGAKATVTPPPGFLLSTGQPSCGAPVNVDAYGFVPYYNVGVFVQTEDYSRFLGSSYTTVDPGGQVRGLPVDLTAPYTGWVRVVAYEYGDGPLGLAPAPASATTYVYVC